jgi:hypothetical protein
MERKTVSDWEHQKHGMSRGTDVVELWNGGQAFGLYGWYSLFVNMDV